MRLTAFFIGFTVGLDCTKKGNYMGTVSVTRKGFTCQRWDTNRPNRVKIKPSNSNHDYCRNPDNDLNGPWCYTTNRRKKWDYCNVDECVCHHKCLPQGDNGSSYLGDVSRTLSGYTCQAWNSNSPHKPNMRPDDANHNHCRNLDNDENGPWCYTTNPAVRWEICDIPRCAPGETQCGSEITPSTPPPTSTSGPMTPSRSCGKNFGTLEFARKYAKVSVLGGDGRIKDKKDYFPGENSRKRRTASKPHPRDESVGTNQVRIVNGQPVEIGAIPHQAALRESSDPDIVFCGGTIIAAKWVVTAAHCTDRMRSREIVVTAGHLTNNIRAARAEPNFQETRVESIIEHKDWDVREVVSDIVMLKLAKALIFSQAVYPACLPPPSFRSDREVYTTSARQKEGTICIISGWGKTEGLGDNSRLQSATLPIMKLSQCNQLLGAGMLPDERNLCAGYLQGGIDTCQGDSGGPLTCNIEGSWTVTGVVSWGIGCADRKSPGAYTRVTQFTEWINHVQAECDNPSSRQCKTLTYRQNPR